MFPFACFSPPFSCLECELDAQRYKKSWLSRKIQGAWVLDNTEKHRSKSALPCSWTYRYKKNDSVCVKPSCLGFSNWHLNTTDKRWNSPESRSLFLPRWSLALTNQIIHSDSSLSLTSQNQHVSKFCLFYPPKEMPSSITSFHKHHHQPDTNHNHVLPELLQ